MTKIEISPLDIPIDNPNAVLGYEGLFTFPEILRRLCCAILIQAIRDRAHLEYDSNYLNGKETKDSLNEWFSGEMCEEICKIINFKLNADSIDWRKIKYRRAVTFSETGW